MVQKIAPYNFQIKYVQYKTLSKKKNLIQFSIFHFQFSILKRVSIMKKFLATILAMFMLASVMPAQAINAKVRIMDLTHIKGVRENQLVGYGVVVGLPGTGDNSR